MVTQKCAARPRVCLFDSGIGGINLLLSCERRVPSADYYYFADNYNVPYGNLAEGRIKELVFSAFKKMEKLRPSAVVLACNTATAVCARELRKMYPFPVIGVEPALRQAWELGGRALVLATRATCQSAAFAALYEKYGGNAEVFACDELAQRVERGILSDELSALACGLPEGEYSSVVLGCTHYVFIKKYIERRYRCPVFDGMLGTADHLADILGIDDHFLGVKGKIEFFCGNTTKNRIIYERFKHYNV